MLLNRPEEGRRVYSSAAPCSSLTLCYTTLHNLKQSSIKIYMRTANPHNTHYKLWTLTHPSETASIYTVYRFSSVFPPNNYTHLHRNKYRPIWLYHAYILSPDMIWYWTVMRWGSEDWINVLDKYYHKVSSHAALWDCLDSISFQLSIQSLNKSRNNRPSLVSLEFLWFSIVRYGLYEHT